MAEPEREPPPSPQPQPQPLGGGGGALSWMSELTRALDHGIQSAGTFLEVCATRFPVVRLATALTACAFASDELCSACEHARP